MIKTVFALAAAAIVATSPLAARTKAEPAPMPSSSEAPAKVKPQTRYCVQTELTGSRIPRRTCQTRDQWLAEGFDPLAK